MSEIIEHELNQLHGQQVCVVRPYFGSQSDSWTGHLTALRGEDYPLKFHFGTAFHFAILFIADDVVGIDDPQEDIDNHLPTIRLKGPADYVRPYQPTPLPQSA